MVQSLLELFWVLTHLANEILTVRNVSPELLWLQKVDALDRDLPTHGKKFSQLVLVVGFSLPLNLSKVSFTLFSSFFHSKHFPLERVNGFLCLGVNLLDLRFLARPVRILLRKADLFLDNFFLSNLSWWEHYVFYVVKICKHLKESVGFLIILFYWLLITYLSPLLNQV